MGICSTGQGALGQSKGMGCVGGGRRFKREGIYVYPRLIPADV